MSGLVIGSRGSALALWQARWVKAALEERLSGVQSSIQIIRTEGDRADRVPFPELEGKGFFVKEMEEALLEGSIDLAVHSMKDLPSEIAPGLALSAVTERERLRPQPIGAVIVIRYSRFRRTETARRG